EARRAGEDAHAGEGAGCRAGAHARPARRSETRLVSLAGLAPRPQAQGRIIWNARAGGLLVAADLPPPPAGKVYELWAIAGGEPLPAGLFTVDAEGKASLAVAPLAGVATVDVFAVTAA